MSTAPVKTAVNPPELDNLRLRVGLGILITSLIVTAAVSWSASIQTHQLERTIRTGMDESAAWRRQLIEQGNIQAATTPAPGERLVWISAGAPMLPRDKSLQLDPSPQGQVLYDSAESVSYLASSIELSTPLRAPLSVLTGQSPEEDTLLVDSPQEAEQLMVLRPETPLIASRQQVALGGLFGAALSILMALAGGSLLGRQSRRELSVLQSDSATVLLDHRRSPGLTISGSPEMQAVRRTFNQMLRELQRTMDQQDRFLSDVSHELRSPITSIHGHARLILRRHRPNPESVESLGTIVRESERMGRMVADLLDLQRHEGAAGAEYQPVDLAELARQVQQMDPERHNSDGQPVTVTVTGAATAPGEPDRLTQVMINLINNATAAGADHVEIELREEEQAIIQIRDNGRGIDPEDLPRVFERFYRADESRQRNRGGSGLGLAITLMIIQTLHQGQITLDSAGRGQGATVTIRLPRIKAEQHRGS